MNRLSDDEIQFITQCRKEGKPLPDSYRYMIAEQGLCPVLDFEILALAKLLKYLLHGCLGKANKQRGVSISFILTGILSKIIKNILLEGYNYQE